MNNALTLHAPAKINLFLHVTGRREDGYHLLESMVVFADDIYDTLHFHIAPKSEITLNTMGHFAPALTQSYADHQKDDLVLRAARFLAQHTSISQGAHIILEKNLPLGAGLGGGSADAAACLIGLQKLWGLSLSDKEIDAIAIKLGADVPICLRKQPCIMRGIGEDITFLPPLPHFYIVLVYPQAHCSTSEIFTHLNLTKGQLSGFPNSPLFPSSSPLSLATLIAFLQDCRNDLTRSAIPLQPVISEALSSLSQQKNCLYAAMTGSGSACFGIFEHAKEAKTSQNILQDSYPSWWIDTSAIRGLSS